MVNEELSGKVEDGGKGLFDSELGVSNLINQKVAKERNWRFNFRTRNYEDLSGCPIADEYGQRY